MGSASALDIYNFYITLNMVTSFFRSFYNTRTLTEHEIFSSLCIELVSETLYNFKWQHLVLPLVFTWHFLTLTVRNEIFYGYLF